MKKFQRILYYSRLRLTPHEGHTRLSTSAKLNLPPFLYPPPLYSAVTVGCFASPAVADAAAAVTDGCTLKFAKNFVGFTNLLPSGVVKQRI